MLFSQTIKCVSLIMLLFKKRVSPLALALLVLSLTDLPTFTFFCSGSRPTNGTASWLKDVDFMIYVVMCI